MWDGTVYVGSSDGNLDAIQGETGDILWSFHTGDRVDSSLAVADGVVYVGSIDDFV